MKIGGSLEKYPDIAFMHLPILMCIADDTKWLFFRIVPPPSAGEQYTTKLYCSPAFGGGTIHNQIGIYALKC